MKLLFLVAGNSSRSQIAEGRPVISGRAANLRPRAMTDRCRCYGTMFPDFTRLRKNVLLTSPAFSALVENQGMGVQGWKLEAERAGWEQCVACADYRTCYDLSLAKLLMNALMANKGYGK